MWKALRTSKKKQKTKKTMNEGTLATNCGK